VDLSRQFGIVRRWLPLLLLGIVLAAVPAYLYSSRQAQVIEASATVLPQQLLPAANPDYNEFSIARLVGLSSTWAVLADEAGVLNEAAQRLGLDETSTELARQVDASADLNTGALIITARASTSERAAALANAVAHVVQDQSSPPGDNSAALIADLDAARKRMLDTEAHYRGLLAQAGPLTTQERDDLLSTQTLLSELRATYDSLAASLVRPVQGLTVVADAVPAETRQIAPRTSYYTLLAIVAGLLVAAGIAFILEYMDDRIKDPVRVREVTGLRTLSAIGKRRRFSRSSEKTRLPTLLDPESAAAEAYRSLRANIELTAADVPVRSIAIVSAMASEGKTITAANLAIAYAQTGRRVVLIDADLRRPAVHTLFRLGNLDGLTSILRDPEVPVANVTHAVPQQDHLRILTSGPLPIDPAGLLASDRMRQLTERLLEQADLLVFDTPPLEVAVDAAVLGSHVDGSVLVIDASRSHRRPVEAAVATMTEADASLLGALLYRAHRGMYPDHRDYSKGIESGSVTSAVKRADSA
jgi:polysaccharide biosynthesis transport protein